MTEYPDAGRDRDRFVGSAPGPVLTAEGGVAAGSTVTPDLAGEPTSIRPDSKPGERPEERGAYGEQRTAERAKQAAGTATKQVAETAKHEASHVASDVADQARRVAGDAKQKLAERAEGQQKQWSGRLGEISYDLRQMAASRPDTPARSLVTQLADQSSMLAGYLSEHRPQELLGEVQDFARRKPGTFLVAMAAAGFVAGRLGRSVSAARREGDGA